MLCLLSLGARTHTMVRVWNLKRILEVYFLLPLSVLRTSLSHPACGKSLYLLSRIAGPSVVPVHPMPSLFPAQISLAWQISEPTNSILRRCSLVVSLCSLASPAPPHAVPWMIFLVSSLSLSPPPGGGNILHLGLVPCSIRSFLFILKALHWWGSAYTIG